jgi:2-polyprenyl-3-methyl-5-hydroxy-6-metoxy-1,4-benzoquinol methylase
LNERTQLEATYAAHHSEQQRYGFGYRAKERGPQFAAWIGTGKRVLDLGCRDGVLTQHYVAGNQVTGVDIDQQALAQAARRLGIPTFWLNLNCEKLPFEQGAFDVVVAGELLEHLADTALLVREARRVLAPEGAFVGSVPNSFHWRARLAYLQGRSIEDPTHLQRFSRSTLLKLLQGFARVQVLPVGGMGGRLLPTMPGWASQPLVRALPTLLANDFLFLATTRRQ